MNINISNLFDKIVGQKQPIRLLSHLLYRHQETQLFSRLMLNSCQGQGKTTLAVQAAKGLFEYDDNGKIVLNNDKPRIRNFLEINCASLGTLSQFINDIVIPHVQDKQVTLFFDEASEIPRDISFALLTILNPNSLNKTSYLYKDYQCDFDFKKQSFIFATAEPQKVNEMLLDRLDRIDLEDYSLDELAQIVKMGCSEINFQDKVIEDIALVLRGNARSAHKMSETIKSYLGNKKEFGSIEWVELKAIFGIYPLGLNITEFRILKLLAQQKGTSLTGLSSKIGMPPETLRQCYEKYLTKQGLMEIMQGSGRQLTAKGLNYLKEIKDIKLDFASDELQLAPNFEVESSTV